MTEAPPIIWPEDLLPIYRIKPPTLRKWIAEGRLPPKDVRMSRKKSGWNRETLEAAGHRFWG